MTAPRPDKPWWTATEIAGSGLPGLPATQKGVELLAKRDGWRKDPRLSRQRTAKGGGWEYSWELFPEAVRCKLLKDARTRPGAPADPGAALAELRCYYSLTTPI